MSQFFTPSGLRSRSDEVRLKAARDLQKFVSTELRELPDDRCAPILEEVNQNIFTLVSSAEVHEKKGGILAIGERLCGANSQQKSLLASELYCQLARLLNESCSAR